MTEAADVPYRVAHSEAVREQLRSLARQTVERGIGQPVADALKAILARLQTDPLNWGEIDFGLQHLNLLVYHAIQGPLVVCSAVDGVRKIVYLKEYRPMPGTPLA
jgi:hypothetical protein